MGIFDRFFGPPSPADFIGVLLAGLRRAGDDRTFEYDPELNCIHSYRNGEVANTINPVNFYKMYCAASRRDRKRWLRATCEALLNPREAAADFEDARPRLRPALRSRTMLDLLRLQIETNGGTSKETPAIDVSEYLVACLVEDQGQAMRFVSGEDLQAWGVPLYLAMETAIQNLEEDSPEMYLRVGEALYMFRTGDAYDATRMLALDLMHRLKVKGQLLALPLERDRLLVTGTEDEVGLMLMATVADDEEQNEGHPVCSIPHVLIGDEWQVWTPPEGHPTEELFRVLALKSSGSEYLDQEALLQKWLEAKGSDAFVAGFGELEHKSDGRLRSWCAWSKGVPTWLPKTDLIAFYETDTETRYMVEWNRAIEQFGSLMQPMECWPPRWKVEAFPDPLELEKLKLEGHF